MGQTVNFSRPEKKRTNLFWDDDFDGLFGKTHTAHSRKRPVTEAVAKLKKVTQESTSTVNQGVANPNQASANAAVEVQEQDDTQLETCHAQLDEADRTKLKTMYLVGNVIGQRIINNQGKVVAEKGEQITLELVNKVENEGKLAELIIGMDIPEME